MNAEFLNGDLLGNQDGHSSDHTSPAETVAGSAETRKLGTEALELLQLLLLHLRVPVCSESPKTLQKGVWAEEELSRATLLLGTKSRIYSKVGL